MLIIDNNFIKTLLKLFIKVDNKNEILLQAMHNQREIKDSREL